MLSGYPLRVAKTATLRRENLALAHGLIALADSLMSRLVVERAGIFSGDLPPAWARSGRPRRRRRRPAPPPSASCRRAARLDQVFRQAGDELDLSVGRGGQQDGQPSRCLRRRTSMNWRISSAGTLPTAWTTTVAPATLPRLASKSSAVTRGPLSAAAGSPVS